MNGILFNSKLELDKAVLSRIKTRTWRQDLEPRFNVGDIVAIRQNYESARLYYLETKQMDKATSLLKYKNTPGWKNKLYVKNDLMPHFIKILEVTKRRLQDISAIEIEQEGIIQVLIPDFSCYNVPSNKRQLERISIGYTFQSPLMHIHATPIEAFKELINKLNNSNYWQSNPEGHAYKFELLR